MSIATPPSLEKRRPDPDGLDFDGLRASGIELLQQMCGARWTDYNLHDPGVTLLEQICYGLTDLVHRAGLPAADYLLGADGRIDGAAHALLPPEQALSCHPLTAEDYRKLIVDALPEVRNVWVEKSAAGLPGLIDIRLQLAAGRDGAAAAAVLQRAAAIYHAHRNLGEDLGGIAVAGHADYRLAGTLEIDGARMAEDVLADIYFACAAAISPPIARQPFHRLAERAPDELFDGPYTPHGRIDAAAFGAADEVGLPELARIVGRVDGVVRIDDLRLLDAAGRPCQTAAALAAPQRLPRLAVPRAAAQLLLRLTCGGHGRAVVHGDFLERLERLEFAAAPRRHAVESGAPLPAGSPPALADYTSIQHHLPPAYGVSGYGVPDSAPLQRRAQARQLQAYLLLFDQVMANFLQGTQELRRLFSTDAALTRSYFHQPVADVPELDALAIGGRAALETGLRAALASVDDFGGRRARSLDFLLALHGEKFGQHALRHFGARAGTGGEGDLLGAKVAFVRQASGINGRRMGGADLRRGPARGNVAGLAQKVALLLGLETAGRHPVTVLLRARGFRHLSDAALRRENMHAVAAALDGAEPAVLLAPQPQDAAAGFLERGQLCPALMNGGPRLERYRIAPGAQGWALYFALDGQGGYLRLSDHADKRAAVACANRTARFLDDLVQGTLACHLVEHILLRPAGSAVSADDSFHVFRVSAVFPAWSPRLTDPEFRKLAEETLHRCAPAHLCVAPLWLDFDAMAEFERLYWPWQRLVAASWPARGAAAEAQALADFLRRRAASAGQRSRWL